MFGHHDLERRDHRADSGVLEAVGGSMRELERAVDTLRELAARAATDAVADAAYQATMHELHLASDDATEAQRLLLCAQAYAVEERFIPQPAGLDLTQALSPEAFGALIRARIHAGERSQHPMSRHLATRDATRGEIRRFMFHMWHRVRTFYSLMIDLGRRVDDNAARPLFANVADELGCDGRYEAHPEMFKHLLRALELPTALDTREPLTAGQAYLNNRTRCARHGDLAWGWAMAYALECITSTTHAHLHALCKAHGLPPDALLFLELHAELDVEHAAELERVILAQITTAAAQRTFVRSIEHHRRLGRAYWDAIWSEMRADRARSGGAAAARSA